MRRRWIAGFALACLGLTACSRLLSCEDPLERERRERDEALASKTVRAYRAIKVSLRSAPVSADGKPAAGVPAAIAGLTPRLQRLLAPPAEGVELTELAGLALQLKDAIGQVEGIDEDGLPTLLRQLSDASGGSAKELLQLLGYGPAHEHLVLGLLWFAARGTPPGLPLYEFERLRPAEADPALLHLAGPLFRALLYLLHEWPRLSELEWTGYLEQIEKRGPEAAAFLGAAGGDAGRDLALLHTLGRLGRARVREQLERPDEAQADLEAAVRFAEQHGADDELVWLLGCYLALKKGDQEKAAAYLGKLQASPALGEEERALVAEVQGYLRARDGESGLRKLRDGLFAAEALARYGRRAGPVARLERDVQASAPGQRLAGVTEQVRAVLDAFQPAEQVKGLLDKAGEGVKKVLD